MHFPLISNGAVNSVVFSVYGHHLRQLEHNLSEEKRLKRRQKNVFLAGMVAGFIQAYLVCPIELIKVRIQTMTFRGSSWACMKDIFQREGLNGFYRGITPTLYRDVLPYGIYMLTYDWLLDQVEHMGLFRKDDSIFQHNHNSLIVFAGSAAGLLSWLFVVPFDVVKTRMQVVTNPKRHPTMLKCGIEVFKVLNLIISYNLKLIICGKADYHILMISYNINNISSSLKCGTLRHSDVTELCTKA